MELVTVAVSMFSLNVAASLLSISVQDDPFVGDVETTLGGVVSDGGVAVSNDQDTGAIPMPFVDVAAEVTIAWYLVGASRGGFGVNVAIRL